MNYEPLHAFAEKHRVSYNELCVAVREALAAPQPEPVAYGMLRADGLILDVICADEHESYQGEYTVPLYAAPPAAPAPAVREPLTDDGIWLLWTQACEKPRLTRDLVCDFARAIEAHHGIGGGK